MPWKVIMQCIVKHSKVTHSCMHALACEQALLWFVGKKEKRSRERFRSYTSLPLLGPVESLLAGYRCTRFMYLARGHVYSVSFALPAYCRCWLLFIETLYFLLIVPQHYVREGLMITIGVLLFIHRQNKGHSKWIFYSSAVRRFQGKKTEVN